MTRPGIWKVLTVSVALGGFGLVGAGAAMAQDTAPMSSGIITSVEALQTSSTDTDSSVQLDGDKAASASQNQTRSSTEIFTAPNPSAGAVTGPYGPFFHQTAA